MDFIGHLNGLRGLLKIYIGLYSVYSYILWIDLGNKLK